MNITLDQINANQKSDSEAGVFAKSAGTQKQGGAERFADSYAFQLQGMQEGNNAYGRGEDADVLADGGLNTAAISDLENQKNYMLVMAGTVSDEEFGEMMQEGYRPGEMEPEEIVTVVDEIKEIMAKSGTIIAGYNDDLDLEKLEAVTGSAASAQAIKKAMEDYRLPDTETNEQEMEKALSIARQMEPLSDGAKKYLLENHLEPTLENMYLASHSGAADAGKQATGYFAEGLGYYGRKADGFDAQELRGQIDKIIEEAGYEVNEENRKMAGWLVENGLTLTQESFEQLKRLNEIEYPLKEEEAAAAAARALKDGRKATDAVLWETKTYEQKAAEIIDALPEITQEAAGKVLEDGGQINLKNLWQAQREINAAAAEAGYLLSGASAGQEGVRSVYDGSGQGGGIEGVSTQADTGAPVDPQQAGADADFSHAQQDEELRQLTVMRQLQEIRLQMTVSTGAFLLRNGIAIDTRELGQLVEDLKFAVQRRNEILFRQETIAENERAREIWRQSGDVVRELPSMPAALVGRVSMRSSFTLNIAYEEGVSLRSAYEEAGEKYEPLMTAPRADLGDSMAKAFRNVDDLMRENGIEVNEANAKAVRILGYNQMEITAQSVEKVRTAYDQLDRVIRKMTPAATLQMIRDQQNPLEMDMQQLETYLDSLDRDKENSAEKYSSFLVRMQESGQVTEQEQESYIGIYRMLHQIERRDSAALGAVLNQGGDVTFKNLLSSVRSRKSQGMDFEVDDRFGALDEVVAKGASITEQLEAAFHKNLPGKADAAGEAGLDKAAQNSTEAASGAGDLRQAERISDDVIYFLHAAGIAFTMDNLLAAKSLVKDRGSLMRQIFSTSDDSGKEDVSDQEPDSSRDILDEILSNQEDASVADISAKMINAFTDRSDAGKAYEEMADRLQELLENQSLQTNGVIDLKEISLSMKQLSLCRSLAQTESYEIPMQLGGQITSVNVKLVHDSINGGKISIYSESGMYGMLQASFEAGTDGLNGYIVGTDGDALKQLEERFDEFLQTLSGYGITAGKMNFIQSDRFQVNYLAKEADVNSGSEMKKSDGAESQERIPTKTLYETAKAFLVLMNS